VIRIQTVSGKDICFYDPTHIEFTEDVVSVYFPNGSTHISRNDVKIITEVVADTALTTHYTIYSGVEKITPWKDLVKNGRKLNQVGNKASA
jgi:hypothetical protein